jgi:uncharacterized protein (TIGR03435 family)
MLFVRHMRTSKQVMLMLCMAGGQQIVAQAPMPQASAAATFDVVSIKRNTTDARESRVNVRPDGGLTLVNLSVIFLINRAYPHDGGIVGLPAWAQTERYDVRTTSSLPNATTDQSLAMVRAMLADRFGLVVHMESHEQPAYDLLLARSDRRLGPGLKPLDLDCERITAERTAGPPAPAQPPDFGATPPTCTLRTVGAPLRDSSGDKQGRLGDLLEGEGTMALLAQALRFSVVRPVVDKTGLSGSYRVTMNFDMRSGRGVSDAAAAPGAAPSVFTALAEQLGLRLESSRTSTDTLVIDHFDRPTEN